MSYPLDIKKTSMETVIKRIKIDNTKSEANQSTLPLSEDSAVKDKISNETPNFLLVGQTSDSKSSNVHLQTTSNILNKDETSNIPIPPSMVVSPDIDQLLGEAAESTMQITILKRDSPILPKTSSLINSKNIPPSKILPIPSVPMPCPTTTLSVVGPPVTSEAPNQNTPPVQAFPETTIISYPRLPLPSILPTLRLRGPPFPCPRIGLPRGPPPRLPMNHGPRPDMMMVPPVPPGIPSDLWEWFYHSDEDKDGRITASEVQRLLLKGKWSPFKEETCKMMLDMMDIDKIGTLDAYQMTSLWNSLLEWKNIFDELDTEKRGSLNASQMFKALEKFGYRLSSEFCDAVVDRFASAQDEKGSEQVLYFDDFIQTRVMLKSLTESFQIYDINKVGVIDLHYEQFLEMVLTNAM